MTKDEQMYPQPTRDLVEQRNRLAPGPAEPFNPSASAFLLTVRFLRRRSS